MYRPVISRITEGIKYATSGEKKAVCHRYRYNLYDVCQNSVLWHTSALSYGLGLGGEVEGTMSLFNDPVYTVISLSPF